MTAVCAKCKQILGDGVMLKIKSILAALVLTLSPLSLAFGTGDEYYNHSTYPPIGSLGSSAAMRAELDLIEAGFGKLPNLAGNANKTVQVNSAGTALTAAVIEPVTVESFGAVGDGVTNDAAAIQAAINSVGASGGGVVKFTSSVYAITTGLTNVYNNVFLIGTGGGNARNGTPDFDQASSVIKWTGAAGATMYLMGPTAGAQYGVKGGGVKDIFWECNSVAATGIKVTTIKGSAFEGVVVENCTTVAFDVATEPTLTADPPDTQENWFTSLTLIQQSATSGIGLRLNGTATGDVSVNHFGLIFILHRDGVGLDIGTAGGNSFDHVRLFRSGTAVGVLLRASAGSSAQAAHRNVFVYLQAHTGGLTSQGTETAAFPAINNHVLNYTLANAGPLPIVGLGSSLAYNTDEGQLRVDSDSPSAFLEVNRAITSGTIGDYKFSAFNTTPAQINYGKITGIINDGAAASEDGELRITTKVAGADVIQAQILDGWCIGAANGCALGVGKVNVEGATGGFYVDGMKLSGMENVTYSASMTPDLRNGHVHRITVTNGVAFTINSPINRDATAPGIVSTFMIRNTSGGALGAATWNAIFKLGAAWAQPANGFSHSIQFMDDGTNLVEINRTATQVSN